jgi:hypothetical protein
VQRFDSTLGCFVHFHVLVPDGVFSRADDAGAAVFRGGPAPTRADIAAVAARVEKRLRRWLRRRGLLDERCRRPLERGARTLAARSAPTVMGGGALSGAHALRSSTVRFGRTAGSGAKENTAR